MFSASTFAQNICVQGNIVDASTKNKLTSVQITIKKTTKGALSNADGSFLLYANKGDTLVFSLFGYNSKELSVNADEKVDIYLTKNESSIVTTKAIDAVIFYPLMNDVTMNSDIQKGRKHLYIYPLLVLNNVIIRDSTILSKFRNTIKYKDIIFKKHITKPEAEELGIVDVPFDGVLFVETKRNCFFDIIK